MRKLVLVPAVLISLLAFGQQSNPPRQRVERTPPPNTPTTQTPTEQPPQTQEPRTARTPQAEQAPATTPSAPARTEPSEGEGPQIRPMHFDMTEVPPVQTHHSIRVGGRELRYTATAGRLPIKDAEGKVEAEMFFVAYTLDGSDPSTRPLTFSFNGGPGSASIWLHMGAMGPRKVVLQPQGWMPPAPYRLEDNPNTPLDRTDIVMVDAIGTGWSRPADTAAARKFWNMRGDIEAFGEFIRLYLSRNERWSSPLYLFGESYGTTRSAGIAGYLANRGISFNGIVLLSTVLSFETLEFAKTNDVPFPLILPSFTWIAGYHKKLPSDLQGDVAKAAQEARDWALGEYWAALNKGDALTPQEHANIVDKLARYTGLSKQIIEWANLRIDVRTFTHYLLSDQKLHVGRLDGRYTGPDPDGFMDTPFYDPTSSQTGPPFTSVFNDYVRRELNYKTDMPYWTSAQQSGNFRWSWSGVEGFGGGYPDTASALRQAIVKNPYLRVLVMEGHYDLATPYAAAEYTMDHLDLTPQYHKNISYTQYESGHMVYLDSQSHAKMKQDFVNFIDATMQKSR
ncbi:MAG: peptidase S10 [Acidobacteria bacterium]|nr:MAG: peptidase S10 [Acidobacteriota bacterium]